MAILSSVFRLTTSAPTIVSINTASSSTATALPCKVFIITSDTDVFLKFGGASVGAATTSDEPLWARSYATFEADLNNVSNLRIYNNTAGTALVYIWPVAAS